jgi:SAM-dependent methyltransferase
MTTYAFDNAWQQARQRLAMLEEGLDPATRRRMTALGVGSGWACLDVGAGGGSIAQWLCAQVGASGRVVATDIDTRFLDALTEPNLDVRRHNIVTDPLPEGEFDLVHTRMVVMHLPERAQVIERLIAALKPGGRLLLEEQDTFPIEALATGVYADTWAAFLRAIEPFGTCATWARTLPTLLAATDLIDVRVEGDIPFFAGASPIAEFWRLTWDQLRGGILKAGGRDDDLAATQQLLTDPEQRFVHPAIIAAWGRRPSA